MCDVTNRIRYKRTRVIIFVPYQLMRLQHYIRDHPYTLFPPSSAPPYSFDLRIYSNILQMSYRV